MENSSLQPTKKYRISGSTHFEMIISLLILANLFLPAIVVTTGGSVFESISVFDKLKDYRVFLILTLLIPVSNFVIKFFFRASWLSLVTAYIGLFPILLSDKGHSESFTLFDITISAGPGPAFFFAFPIIISMLLSVTIYWGTTKSYQKLLIATGGSFILFLLSLYLPIILEDPISIIIIAIPHLTIILIGTTATLLLATIIAICCKIYKKYVDKPKPTDNITNVEDNSTLKQDEDAMLQKNDITPDKHQPTREIKTKKSDKKKLFGVIIGCMVIIVALIASYFLWLKPLNENSVYTISDNICLRSSKSTNYNDDNIIDVLPYGTELTVLSKDEIWTEVTYNDEKGYIPLKYVLEKKDFEKLEDIWGNENARQAVSSAKHRIALLDYCKTNELEVGENGWQLFTIGTQIPDGYYQKSDKIRRVYLSNYYNGESFAFILVNNDTDEQKCVVYSFDNKLDLPVCVYEESVERNCVIKGVEYDKNTYKYTIAIEEIDETASQSKASKKSSDVILYELKGKVKRMKTEEYDADSEWNLANTTPRLFSDYWVKFKEDGTAIKLEGYLEEGVDYAITRDSEGRIINYTSPHEGDFNYSYKYDEKGRISHKEVTHGFTTQVNYTYEYDEHNRVIKSIWNSSDVSYSSEGEDTYVYTKFDEQENWTERRIKSEYISSDYEKNEKKHAIDKRIEKRDILYY